jgi:hypothetical protein
MNKVKQCTLRNFSKTYGDQAIIAYARGGESKTITGTDAQQIKDIFADLLGDSNLTKFTPDEFLKVLEPEALLEKFAYKKANKIGKQADTFDFKGMKG